MDARSDKKERREQLKRGEERGGRCLGLTVLPLIPVGYSHGSSDSPPHPGGGGSLILPPFLHPSTGSHRSVQREEGELVWLAKMESIFKIILS